MFPGFVQFTTKRRCNPLHQPVFCTHPMLSDITTLDPNSCWAMEIFHKTSATVTKQEKSDH